MRIVLWIGNEPNQRALAGKIHERFQVAGIITESRIHKRRITFKKLGEKLFEKVFLGDIARAWYGMHRYYTERFPAYPDVPLLDVENINDEKTYQFTKDLAPDLVIVSGTRMVKKNLLSIPAIIGILNLHTGLSPYIKGGPNCTNWCIATGQFHLIGNTIMWIDEGIDSGNIMSTEFTKFTGDETLAEVHIKVMEHAHDLYLRAIESIKNRSVNNIPQKNIAEGITYYNRQWSLKEKRKLVRNMNRFKQSVSEENLASQRFNIKIVPLDQGNGK